MRTPIALLIGATALSLGACATDGYGGGGLAYGYGSPFDDGYCLNYPSLSCGWYGDYFYPGRGGFMYDRGRGRHNWDGGGGRTHTAGGFGGGHGGGFAGGHGSGGHGRH
jgi:hypothetical protein